MRRKRSSTPKTRPLPYDRARNQGLTLLLFMVALAVVVAATLMTV